MLMKQLQCVFAINSKHISNMHVSRYLIISKQFPNGAIYNGSIESFLLLCQWCIYHNFSFRRNLKSNVGFQSSQ